MKERLNRRSLTNLYQWSVILLGAAALVLQRPSWSKEPEVLLTLLMLFSLAEYFQTRVKVGGIGFSYPITYTGFLLYGVPGAVWVACCGTLLANLARRRSWRVTLFNGTQFALAATAAGWLSLHWPGNPSLQHYLLPLLAHLFLYFTVNNLIVDTILWLRLKTYRLEDWFLKNRYVSISAAVSFAYCVLLFLLAPQQRGHDPLALIFFFLPLLTVGGFTRLLTNLALFAQQMKTLLDVSTLTTANPDGAQALEAALAHLDTFDEYRFAAVYQVEGDELAILTVRGLPLEAVAHQRIEQGAGLTGLAAQSGEPVYAKEAAQDPRNSIGEGVREGALMIAAIPLINSGQVMGVLTVGKERSHSLQPEDVRLLTIFANLLAAILRNLHQAEERERLLLLKERNRLAREIHDGIAQSLAGALLQMDRLERLLEAEPKSGLKLLHNLREYMRECLLDVRRSIYNLRPSPLESHGLIETLRQEMKRLREKGLSGNAQIRMEVRGEQRRLSALVEDEVFRIAQEGLTNALKHADASQVNLTLHFSEQRLRLTLRDDGKGFHLADAVRQSREGGSYGLVGINERAERLGAHLDIESRPGAGTRLVVDIPLMGE